MYALQPFILKVQSIERTFIDKVFAISDYYLDEKTDGHSRHIYDLYKLYPTITFNDSFAELIENVRKARKPHKVCVSAQDGIHIPQLLQSIISRETFKSDYNKIMDYLLFEKLPYSDAITVLQKIIDAGHFS